MEPKTKLSFLEAGLYIGYMNYYATGEGMRSCIAVAGSADEAERLLKEKLPGYFHGLIVTALMDAGLDDDATQMIAWIPEPAKPTMARIPNGTGEPYAKLYYNVA